MSSSTPVPHGPPPAGGVIASTLAGHRDGLGEGVSDALSITMAHLLRTALGDPDQIKSRPLLAIAKVVNATPGGGDTYSVLAALLAATGTEAGSKLLGIQDEGTRLILRDAVRESLTGATVGVLDSLRGLSPEEIEMKLEEQSRSEKTRKEAVVNGADAGKTCVVIHSVGSDRKIYRTWIVSGVIQRDEFGHPLSRHPEFMRLHDDHYMRYPPEMVAEKTVVTTEGDAGGKGGKGKKGTTKVEETKTRVERVVFRSEAMTYEEAATLAGFTPHPDEFPGWDALVASARAEAAKAKAGGHDDHGHEKPKVDWLKDASDELIAVLVAAQAIDPTWYDQVVANDLFGDLIREGMNLRILEQMVSQLAATSPDGWNTPYAQFITVERDGKTRTAVHLNPAAMPIIKRTVDNLGPGEKDLATKGAGVLHWFGAGVHRFVQNHPTCMWALKWGTLALVLGTILVYVTAFGLGAWWYLVGLVAGMVPSTVVGSGMQNAVTMFFGMGILIIAIELWRPFQALVNGAFGLIPFVGNLDDWLVRNGRTIIISLVAGWLLSAPCMLVGFSTLFAAFIVLVPYLGYKLMRAGKGDAVADDELLVSGLKTARMGGRLAFVLFAVIGLTLIGCAGVLSTLKDKALSVTNTVVMALPGPVEICNNKADDDLDGKIDEAPDCTEPVVGPPAPTAFEKFESWAGRKFDHVFGENQVKGTPLPPRPVVVTRPTTVVVQPRGSAGGKSDRAKKGAEVADGLDAFQAAHGR